MRFTVNVALQGIHLTNESIDVNANAVQGKLNKIVFF